MTTPSIAVAKAKSTPQLPVELLADLQSTALSIQNSIGAPSGDFITVTRQKTFKMPGSDAEAPQLRAIIVHWATLHQYYPGKFDSKNPQPPVCVATSLENKGLIPFPGVPSRQHDNCDECPQNQWVDKKKACKNQYLLALLPVDNQAEGELMLIKVSPTGLKHFDKFYHKVKALLPATPHPCAVIATIKCDDRVDYPSLTFEIEGVNHDIVVAASRRKAAAVRLLTPPTFTVPITPAKVAVPA